MSPALKAGLEEAARRRRQSVARLLDGIVEAYLTSHDDALGTSNVQRRLQRRAARFAGCLAGDEADRAARARLLVRARLRRNRRAG